MPHNLFVYNRIEIRFANLTLICSQQILIRAITMGTYLVAITKKVYHSQADWGILLHRYFVNILFFCFFDIFRFNIYVDIFFYFEFFLNLFFHFFFEFDITYVFTICGNAGNFISLCAV